jgi:hypothetical protein
MLQGMEELIESLRRLLWFASPISWLILMVRDSYPMAVVCSFICLARLWLTTVGFFCVYSFTLSRNDTLMLLLLGCAYMMRLPLGGSYADWLRECLLMTNADCTRDWTRDGLLVGAAVVLSVMEYTHLLWFLLEESWGSKKLKL